ncbi:MAG: hypothetical protein LC667_17880, partial [Thioalkalivibrio sp.]|nr:hypothetical protein [Thioalkalivibrio sp.]
SFAMTYDTLGNVASISEPARMRSFGYDELERLVSQIEAPAPAGLYDYDAVGNRLSSPLSAAHSHNAANRLTSDDGFTYTYDANGNLATRTSASGPTTGQVTTYHWNTRSELTAIDLPMGGRVDYRYDALGRRIEKNVDAAVTRYLYDGEDIALETDAAGSLLRRYRHGDGTDQPLVLEDAQSGESFFYHTDHLGSVVMLTDEDGMVAAKYEYDAYGRRTAVAEAVDQPYAFTGREWDEESGLYYYRARYYDPAGGRFLSEDPIGFGGGDLNLYRYVKANPVRFTDPYGLYRNPYDIADDAGNDARDSGLPGQHNGPQDAYRHCLASCEAARENGQAIAEFLGWANERKGDWEHKQDRREREMDEHNNSCGRQLGDGAASKRQCERGCRLALDYGILRPFLGPGTPTAYSPPIQGLPY